MQGGDPFMDCTEGLQRLNQGQDILGCLHSTQGSYPGFDINHGEERAQVTQSSVFLFSKCELGTKHPSFECVGGLSQPGGMMLSSRSKISCSTRRRDTKEKYGELKSCNYLLVVSPSVPFPGTQVFHL